MSETKPTNPKDAVGSQKVPMHTVPLRVLLEMGLGMLDGGCKYGTHNYREAGVRGSVYFDAACRHLFAWWEGEEIDPDSGIHHIVKAMTTLAVLRDSQHMGNWVDDRPPRLPGGAGVAELNAFAAELLRRYPSPAAPFTHIKGVLSESPAEPEACFEENP
ncbi:DUF5664 domain-containing protein [Candidatus Pacearchaeota archaeon]|jgi:hypothetical protein|nr:DUF5664 domain-containing protein [Candidatus Pacearchaeota archaeon]